jgi:sugar phosphate isomerase/epimerase
MSVKLAAYTDEIFDDPDKAGELLASKKITNVCLRRGWCRDIYNMPDNAISILDGILKKHGLTPILLHTEIGCVNPNQLALEEPKLIRAMQICKYLQCKAIRIGLGTSSKPTTEVSSISQITPRFNPSPDIESIHKWLSTASGLSISYDVQLLFEPETNSYYNQAAAIAILLNKFRRLNLLFDPALLVMRAKTNPFVKFWSLLKSRTTFVDIHDFKTGDAAKPAGFGDAQLDVLVADALASNFSGWFCLEPGLGRRYGDATTKDKTFLRALDAFEALLQRIQLPKIL